MNTRSLMILTGVLALVILIIVMFYPHQDPEQTAQQGWRDFARSPNVTLGNGKRY